MIVEENDEIEVAAADQAAADVGWWRRAVVYQVYIRSFADGDGDGDGDLAGLRSRLDYLADLGIDAIWITPWYPSPMADGGYDVADYRDIHPDFGTLADADAFIAEAHERAIKVILDIVPNHTSIEHPWFQAALAAGPGSPERDRYVFRPGRGRQGDLPPTNWQAVFGGSAWEQVGGPGGEWYLHVFDVSQPDLNWRNPEVLEEFDDVFRFWLERGVDGFRIDVAHGMAKDWSFPDVDEEMSPAEAQNQPDGSHPHWDRDPLHDIVRRWRRIVNGYHDRMMVAEATVHATRLPLYLRPDEYHQSFNFDLLRARWSAKEFSRIIHDASSAAAAIGAASTWVLANHDVVRPATRYGLPQDLNPRSWLLDGPREALDPELGLRRARAAALIALALPGSTYLYQGDELGLPEAWDLPTDVLQDPSWERSGHTDKGRDGSRVPIPWSVEGESFGFGSGPGWLPQPPHFGALSVEAQDNDPDSTLNLHRRALELRDELMTADERITMIDFEPEVGADGGTEVGTGVLAFERGSGAMVIANMGDQAVALPADRTVALASHDLGPDPAVLPPDTTVWLNP